MAQHLLETAESTRRAVRGALQGLSAFAAFLVAVAIPPVADAVNAVLATFGITVTVTPGLVAAIGIIGVALTTLITKLQNVFEGRDLQRTPAEWAAEAAELSQLVNALVAAVKDAGVEVEPILTQAGWRTHDDDEE